MSQATRIPCGAIFILIQRPKREGQIHQKNKNTHTCLRHHVFPFCLRWYTKCRQGKQSFCQKQFSAKTKYKVYQIPTCNSTSFFQGFSIQIFPKLNGQLQNVGGGVYSYWSFHNRTGMLQIWLVVEHMDNQSLWPLINKHSLKVHSENQYLDANAWPIWFQFGLHSYLHLSVFKIIMI